MIINKSPVNEAILSNVGEVGEFRIRNSAKAFGILSSGLYANKIRAIIREYSCNAVDSHIEAGKTDIPFEVHLPSTLEPWFSVRDFGVGLDQDQVRNIFTTYFESTKSGTDDFIGGLGLGSKSAFSYVDNFMITAIKNGKKTIYTAFINNEGVPSIAEMLTEETDEDNGVEIRLAVEKSSDFHFFYREAQHVYTHFKLRPSIINYPKFEFIDPKYTQKDVVPGVHIYGTSSYRSESYAVMGGVAYPIETTHFTPDEAKFLHSGLIIEFGIGELDIQASREGLSYIPMTVQAIKDKLSLLEKALSDLVTSQLAQTQGYWEKFAYLSKKYAENTIWHSPIAHAFNASTIKNEIEAHCKTFNVDGDEEVLEIFHIGNYRSVINVDAKYVAKTFNIKLVYYINGRKNIRYDADEVCCLTDRRAEPLFVENDFKKKVGYITIVREFSGIKDNVWLLDKADPTKAMDVEGFYKFILEPPKSSRYKITEIAEQQKSNAEPSTTISEPKTFKVYLLRRDNYRDTYSWSDINLTNENMDPAATYYYVALDNRKITINGNKVIDKSDAWDFANALGVKLYGVGKQTIAKIKDNPNCVEFFEFAAKKITEPQNKNAILLRLANVDKSKNIHRSIRTLIDSNSEFMKWQELKWSVEENKFYALGSDVLAEILKKVGVTNLIVEAQQTKAKAKEIKERYPLITLLYNYLDDNSNQHVAEYINLIDAKHKA